MCLYRSLLSRFILPELKLSQPESDRVQGIDLDDLDALKDFGSIFIGTMIKQYASDSDIIGTSEYKKFLKRSFRAFFIKCAKYLQASMPVLKNDVIKSLTFLRLPERHKATLDELHVLMLRFPRVTTDMNALESEFIEYQATSYDEFPAYFDDEDHIDHIWHQISKQIDLYSDQPRFKHLAPFSTFLLLIPNRNSYCSIFSTIRKICTDGRHNLGKDATQGHASSNVYTETISIRNNLLGILIPKIMEL